MFASSKFCTFYFNHYGMIKIMSKILTFASRNSGNISGAGSDIKDDGSLHPRNEEVSTLSNHQVLDSLESVKNDCSVSTIN